MNYVGKLLSNFKGFYNEINSATLTGAIDIIIVQQEDGTYVTSPWHVRFGKMGVIRSREKIVDIEINNVPVELHMKLGEAGEAFFVQEAEETCELPAHLATSPIPDSLSLMEKGLHEMHHAKELAIPVPHRTTPGGQELQDSYRERYYSRLVSPTFIMQSNSMPHLSDATLVSKPMVNIAIQTDLTGKQVETKARSRSRSRVLSGDSCISCSTDVSSVSGKLVSSKASLTDSTMLAPSGEQGGAPAAPTGQNTPPANSKDSSKVPSFIRIDSTGEMGRVCVTAETHKGGKTKRKRRRRSAERAKHPSGSSEVPAPPAGSGSSHLEVGSVGSGSSGEMMEEVIFDLEMSDGEEESKEVGGLTSIGRTISLPIIQDKQLRTEEWASSHYASAFHPFSDGDITPIVSPVGSRPPSPKSDTEFETQKYDAMSQTQITGDDMETGDSVEWRWGELPETQSGAAPGGSMADSIVTQECEKEKVTGGLLNFMRKTKKIRHQPEQEGIYLDDLNLNEMDPEVAQLYLYPGKGGVDHKTLKEMDEDNESGRGASLPQSPITVETGSHDILKSDTFELAMSRCGGLKESEGALSRDKFLQYLVTYEEFCANPSMLSDPNLVIKFGEKYYNWQIAGPILMSVLLFQKPLPEDALESLVKQYMPKKERRSRWYWWGRGTAEAQQQANKKEAATSPPPSNPASPPGSPHKKKQKPREEKDKDDGASSDDESDTSVHSLTAKDRAILPAPKPTKPVKERYRKSLKLTSEEIETLNLREGRNEVTFSVTTQFQGTSACSAFIYLWKWDDRLIVSDIDGTITKSDVLGQVLPMIGKDWSQAGIANLYNTIHRNGYRFIYLSARAIGQSKITRDYLTNVRQGALGLPDGPVLLSPSSLISAFHKEVIERKPEEFKISCLKNIQCLFPATRNPFYAGFGNKINDVWAYRAVNIPISRVFTVNHRGELKHETSITFQSTYQKLSDSVDHMFPPLKYTDNGRMASGNFPAPDQYSTFTYWREPLPDIQIEIDSFLETQTTTNKKAANPPGKEKKDKK